MDEVCVCVCEVTQTPGQSDSLPDLLIPLNDIRRPSHPVWMPSPWHASSSDTRMNLFWNEDDKTTEFGYIRRYLDYRASLVFVLHNEVFYTFAIAQIWSWSQRFGFLDFPFGDDWFQEPPRLEKPSNHHNYGVMKWEWIQLFPPDILLSRPL